MLAALIDYGSGNLPSAEKALQRAAATRGLELKTIRSASPESLRGVDRIVLPGVGAFAECADKLESRGLFAALDEAVRDRGIPFLGICVGMQLMTERGLEHETRRGFGWIQGESAPLPRTSPSLKIPHMGWSAARPRRRHPALASLSKDRGDSRFYFAHSYAVRGVADADAVADSEHGSRFVSAIARDAMIGVQFHPEKSSTLGLEMLGDFLSWSP